MELVEDGTAAIARGGGGVIPDQHTTDQPSSLQRHTLRLWIIPDACAMDTLRLNALAAPVHMAKFLNSNVEELFNEHICWACDSDEKACSVVIADSGCSALVFSDWRGFPNCFVTTDIQVKYANGQLTEGSGVDDVDILTNALLVPKSN